MGLVDGNASSSSHSGSSATPRGSHSDLYNAEVVIVGAGTAGATLALQMAEQGRTVTVLERSAHIPERIVGELMQPGGVRTLQRMGLADTVEAATSDSVRVDGYVVFTDKGDELHLQYPDKDPVTAMQQLGAVPAPTPLVPGKEGDGAPGHSPKGRSFWNHRLVENLRAKVRKHPLIHMDEAASVRGLVKDADGVVTGARWMDSTGTERITTGQLTIVCDGCYSVLRKHITTAKPFTASYFSGLVLDHPAFKSPVPHRNYGHVVLAKPNPVLLYQISPTQTRILIDIPAPLPSVEDGSLRKYFEDVVVPQLPKQLRGPVLHAARTQEPMTMPNRSLDTKPPSLKGAILLGDSHNMRHPLTGGGMTVALRDVELFAASMSGVDFGDWATVSSRHKQFLEVRKCYASTVNILANALHAVFTVPVSDDGRRQRLRDACYDYLGKRGPWTYGPVGLLSALTPSPTVLTTHFFIVALYATVRALFPFPSWTRLRQAYELIQCACIIIMPMLEAEGATVLSSPAMLFLADALFPWRKASRKTV